VITPARTALLVTLDAIFEHPDLTHGVPEEIKLSALELGAVSDHGYAGTS